MHMHNTHPIVRTSTILILIILLLTLIVPAAHATHSPAATTVGTGTPESCTETALRAAIAQGGDITFNCGTAAHTIPLSDVLSISRTTTIDGGGSAQGGLITLDGQGRTRIFDVAQETAFTVKNLTLVRGHADGGAAIRGGWLSTLTIVNAVFDGNDGTIDSLERGGGAIATDKNILIIQSSLFRNNRGTNGGALNNLLGPLTVDNSVFEGNEALRGNDEYGDGGAIYIDGASDDRDTSTSGTILIRNSSFTENYAERSGGAIQSWIYGDDQVTIDRALFRDNRAMGPSGEFSFGGGLAHGNGMLTLSNSLFHGNHARSQGGALWIDRTPNGQITNVTIVNNRAEGDPNADDAGYGGGIAGTGSFTCRNCTIAYNSAAERGGGIYQSTGSTLINTLIAHNRAENPWNLSQNCGNTLADGGGNLEFPASSDDSNDHSCIEGAINADPLLAELANNGGKTHTMALQTGSPAIDAGQNDECPTSDQRGAPRPADGTNSGTATCDIGAYEYGSDPGNPGTFVLYLPWLLH